jgi:hypothetical protein
MKITNRGGLPAAIVEAVKNDPYTRGTKRADISATQLISPPRKIELERRFRDQLEEDASDRIWALLGQSVHTILERAEPSELVERRLYADFGGWTVSGQFDRLHVRAGVLQDYKVTSVYSGMQGAKAEWVAQLNVLAELCEQNGYVIERAEVVAIYRDWSKREAAQRAEAGKTDYPPAQVAIIELPLWPSPMRTEFIERRVAAHRTARESGSLPECTKDERWIRDEKWAVMKDGNEKATRVFSNAFDAEVFAKGKGASFFVKHRPGEATRCLSYCAAAPYCGQWQKERPRTIEEKLVASIEQAKERKAATL